MKKIYFTIMRKKLLKKGIQIGVLGSALAAGALTGCKTHTDDQTTLIPDGNGGNQQGGNVNGYDTPYDQKLGNGNYVVHNFLGEHDNIKYDTAVEDTNHYLDLGKTYLTNQYNQFKKSLENRLAAQAYFSNFDITPAVQYMAVGKAKDPYDTNLDLAMNHISQPAEQYFYDMVKNLDTNEERNTFIICHNVMTNQAIHIGCGKNRDMNLSKYQRVREINSKLWKEEWQVSESFDLDTDIDQNNFRNITNTMDKLLTQTANNMNQKYHYDITANDLRQIINLVFNSDTIQSIHDTILPTKTLSKDHDNHCRQNSKILLKMKQAADDAWEESRQQNGMEQSL